MTDREAMRKMAEMYGTEVTKLQIEHDTLLQLVRQMEPHVPWHVQSCNAIAYSSLRGCTCNSDLKNRVRAVLEPGEATRQQVLADEAMADV